MSDTSAAGRDGRSLQLRLPGFRAPISYHYDTDARSAGYAVEAVGPLAVMTRDQLHPPLVDDEEVWSNGENWYRGAVRFVEEAAEACQLPRHALVLDVGAGVGGPARTLVDNYGASVIAVNVSTEQLDASNRINAHRAAWRRSICPLLSDASDGLPVRDDSVDCSWSMNMLYHLPDHRARFAEMCRVLRRGGCLMVDDWMLTPRATEATVAELKFHFYSEHFARTDTVVADISSTGATLELVEDLGIVCRTHLRTHFEREFERLFRPIIEAKNGEWGRKLCDDYVAAMLLVIRLYEEERLTYWRLVARK